MTSSNEENGDEVHIHNISGGPTAFELCAKFRYGISTIVWLLPAKKGSVSFRFLLKLLKVSISLDDSAKATKIQLIKRISQQLEDASASELFLLRSPDLVKEIVEVYEHGKHYCIFFVIDCIFVVFVIKLL